MLASQTLSAKLSSSLSHLKSAENPAMTELEHLLKLIYKGLRVSQQGKKIINQASTTQDSSSGLTSEIFTKFSELPSLVAGALFRAFDDAEQGVLSQVAFVAGFNKLIFGSLQQKLKLVFKMLQLGVGHSESQIVQKHCQTLLYHLGISSGCFISYLHQNKTPRSDSKHLSQADIDCAIESLFSSIYSKACRKRNGRTLGFDKFYQFSMQREADIPVLILSYVLNKTRLVPILNNYMLPESQLTSVCATQSHQSNQQLKETYQFYQFDKLARVRYLRNIPFIKKLHSCDSFSSCIAYKSIYPYEKSKSLDQPKHGDNSLLQQLGVEETKSKPDESPLSKWKSAFLQRKEYEEPRIQNWYSGHVYRFVEESKIRAFWYELRGSELYCKKPAYLVFNTAKSATPKMIISLRAGFFVRNNESLKIFPDNENFLISFDLVFPSGQIKEFIFFDEDEKMKWMDALKEVIGQFDLDEDFEITSSAPSLPGQVSFNAFSLKNGESLLLSEIPKHLSPSHSHLQSQSYLRSLQRSLEAMRMCEHPRIPRLIQVNETEDYFYIATEPCEGGDLPSYLKSTSLNPKLTRHLITQMTEILCFLKKMSIVVGNMSLSSFSLAHQIDPSDPTTMPQLMLTNLREAKIVAHNQESQNLCLAPFMGSAPELLLTTEPVGLQADAFSFGVALCDLLYSQLPFQSLEEILSGQPEIPETECPLGSDIRSNIKRLLIRDPRQRGSIQGFSRIIQLLN